MTSLVKLYQRSSINGFINNSHDVRSHPSNTKPVNQINSYSTPAPDLTSKAQIMKWSTISTNIRAKSAIGSNRNTFTSYGTPGF